MVPSMEQGSQWVVGGDQAEAGLPGNPPLPLFTPTALLLQPSLQESGAKNPWPRLCLWKTHTKWTLPPLSLSHRPLPSPVFVLFKLHQKCHGLVSLIASKLPDKFHWPGNPRRGFLEQGTP